MKTHLLRSALLMLPLALAPLVACVDAGDDLATDEHEIINGTNVTTDTMRWLGLADVGGGCSGVVYRNDWVLTAGHCVNTWDQAAVSITYDGQTRTSDRLLRFAGYADPRGPDLALIHLSTPFTVNGSTTGFTRAVAWIAIGNLPGTAIDLYGRGDNTPRAGGFGTWRTGTVSVASAGGDGLGYNANAAGQTAWLGDSGGPSFNNGNLVGIQSGASYRCDAASPPGQCWPGTILSGNQTYILPVLFGISTAMDRPWNAGRSTDLFDVSGHEIRAAREVENDLNLAPWALERRVADELCGNRGFVGGHFNGHQISGLYGLACSGANATWFDATPSEINATGWGFSDHNLTGWAQVARAAFGVCQAKGYVSGFFNGQQIVGSKYGLVCLKSSNVGHFDATWSELDATGWRVDDTNTVGWAQASRAAHEWCRARSWTTGFMNGHQFNGRYGVTCQRNLILRIPRIPFPGLLRGDDGAASADMTAVADDADRSI